MNTVLRLCVAWDERISLPKLRDGCSRRLIAC